MNSQTDQLKFEQQLREYKRKKRKPWLITLIVITCIVVLGVILNLVTKMAKNQADQEFEAQMSAETYEAFSEKMFWSKEVADDYKSNEVSADRKYKGKDMRVYGKIISIDKDFTNQIIVRLQGDNFMNDMMCYFKDTPAIGKLLKGDDLWFYGRCDGLFMGSVIMRDCHLKLFKGVQR